MLESGIVIRDINGQSQHVIFTLLGVLTDIPMGNQLSGIYGGRNACRGCNGKFY